ncbi:MAG: polymer-forming cytoskeletal protein [Cytophagia bacterium]|nr:MAG: polymer-forming cytoskeletal protein [Cytophagales bacterium]TAG06632.1 MAG: polymer-forming cytoskeletal protein [Cytophagia bacterium]TAG46338.1 MAG: polymer-forming cytoskeletal protein [Cytophagia bacterium]TAH30583.1 MAG: polymer-forming cytoskeletal protein [Cytophagales bacterium]
MAIFGNNKEKENFSTGNTQDLSNANTHVAKGASFRGDIEIQGTLRIEGTVFGNVKGKGKISLGDSGVVEGNIQAQVADIAGSVKGIIEISDTLTLKATAQVIGDLICGKLVVEAGASFNGKCQMGAVPQLTNKPINIPKNEKSDLVFDEIKK